MIRRQLIRVALLLPLAILVGLWIASYFGGLSVRVDIAGRMWVADVAQGQACFIIVPTAGLKPNVYLRFQLHTTAHDWWLDVPFPGFRYSDYRAVPHSYWLIFPMWLPAFLLAALTWIFWRKTRPTRSGRGFPVEPTPSSAKAAPP